MNILTVFPSGRLHGIRDMVPGNEWKVGAFCDLISFLLCLTQRLNNNSLDDNGSHNLLQSLLYYWGVMSARRNTQKRMICSKIPCSVPCHRCDKDIKVSYTVYNRLSVLLKSLLAITRVTPAYKLSRKQGHDYVILYRQVDIVKNWIVYQFTCKWH